MAGSIVSVLNGLLDKTNQLTSLLTAKTERIEELEQSNDILRKEVKEKESEIIRLKTDIEFLKISYKLADSPDKLMETRRLIARYIKSIDKCILMLSKEELR